MVFARLKLIFGHLFRSTFSSDEELRRAKREWIHEISGFTKDQLEIGFHRAKRELEWPDIGKFLKLCEPRLEDYGLPEPDEAYHDACHGGRSHPAVYHARLDTGVFELRTMSEKAVKPKFLENYKKRCDQVMTGEQLSIPDKKMIEHQRFGRPTKQGFVKGLSEARRILGGETTDG